MQIRLSIAEEIDHLPQRMNAGIGSPGTGHTCRCAEKRRYRLLQHRLNRRPIRLHLPAKVIRAVILNAEFDVHEKTCFVMSFVSTRGAAAGGLEIIANQNLGNLDGVESRAFAQIVCHDPEIEAVGNRIVLANSPHVGCILASGLDGHGIDVVFRLIRNNDARSFAQYGFDIRGGEFFSVSMLTDSE